MSATLINFKKQPVFGFAHHIHLDEPNQIQTDLIHSFVILYVKSGQLNIKYIDKTIIAPEGSILVLLRDLPFEIHSGNGEPQDYCSIQVFTDYNFSFIDDNEDFPKDFTGLALPIVTPPGSETEYIKKDMFSIVSHLSISVKNYTFYASMTLCGILSKLDMVYRQKLHKGKTPLSYWEYRIKKYVSEHISQKITINDIAKKMGKTPNYLNHVFKEATGIGIHQYVNREKIHLVTLLMEMRGFSFNQACENVGITDISHGYRLFKKHMGITPKTYISSDHSADSKKLL